MIKKEYMKPTMTANEVDLNIQILAGSLDQYGMNRQLQGTSDPDDEVEEGW